MLSERSWFRCVTPEGVCQMKVHRTRYRDKCQARRGSALGKAAGCRAARAALGTLDKVERKVKDKANPRDATPIKQPAETLEVSRRLENQGTYGVYN